MPCTSSLLRTAGKNGAMRLLRGRAYAFSPLPCGQLLLELYSHAQLRLWPLVDVMAQRDTRLSPTCTSIARARVDILSALKAGTHIVMDRYAYSGVAFTSGVSFRWLVSAPPSPKHARGIRRGMSACAAIASTCVAHCVFFSRARALVQQSPAWILSGARSPTRACLCPTSSSTWISAPRTRQFVAALARKGALHRAVYMHAAFKHRAPAKVPSQCVHAAFARDAESASLLPPCAHLPRIAPISPRPCRRYELAEFQAAVRARFVELRAASDAVDALVWQTVDARGSVEEVQSRIAPLVAAAAARQCGADGADGKAAAPIRRMWDGAPLV